MGEPLSGMYKESYWVTRLEYPINDNVRGFREQLVLAIDRLSENQNTLYNLKETGGSAEIYLQLPGSVNNGDTIEVDILKKEW